MASALRAGAGMVTPLVVGLVTGHLEYGAFAALGAMPAGLVTFQGFSRTRVTAVVLAAFGMAAATFVGSAAAEGNGWWLVPAVTAFSYLAGLLVTLGQRLAVAGLQLPIALLIASGIPLRPGDAALRAVLVLAGGLWQATLVVASWVFLPGGRERSSLAAVYRELGAYAAEHGSRPADAGLAPPSAAFGTDVLEDPNPLLRAPDRARLMLLLEEAGRIRVSLAAVASFGPQRSVLEPAARVLDGLADALGARRGHRHRAAALEQPLAAIELPQDTACRWAAAALLGQLRAAVRLLGSLGESGGEPAVPRAAAGPRRRGARRADLAAALLTLRADAGISTEAGRHALRLAVVTAIGDIIAQASGLPHGYWIALTIVIVLRPDYASTIYRSVQRVGGTVIGVGLGAATVLLLHTGTAALVAATGVTMTIAYAVFAVSYPAVRRLPHRLRGDPARAARPAGRADRSRPPDRYRHRRGPGHRRLPGLALLGRRVRPGQDRPALRDPGTLRLPGAAGLHPAPARRPRRGAIGADHRAARPLRRRGIGRPPRRRAAPPADDRPAGVRPDRHRTPDSTRIAHPRRGGQRPGRRH